MKSWFYLIAYLLKALVAFYTVNTYGGALLNFKLLNLLYTYSTSNYVTFSHSSHSVKNT